LYSYTPSEDRRLADPPIDPTTVVSNLKSRALDRFDQVQVFAAVDFAQNNVANSEALGVDGLDGAMLAGLYFAGH
jgi:hypothetical protein